MNIKKLIVTTIGLGADATFDVVVNGDVKGTIFAPKYDPSYVVTIGEETRSIEFVSRSGGTAEISRVLAVVE